MMLQNYIQGIRENNPLVNKSSKGRQVTFDEGIENGSEEYVVITEDDIGTEKRYKRPKVKIPKNKSLTVNDENVMKKKSKVEHFEVVITNSQEPSETSKESRETITRNVDLENGIIKTKQNAIRQNLTKRKLIGGGHTFQPNVRQIYKESEGKCQYQIRKPHHLHVHNL